MKTFLEKQRKSREEIARAAERYMNLRAATGSYTQTVRTTDREGRNVVVLITFDILPDEG